MQKAKYKLQLTLDLEDKEQAEMVVKRAGFSSLPEAVRFIIFQIINGKTIDVFAIKDFNKSVEKYRKLKKK